MLCSVDGRPLHTDVEFGVVKDFELHEPVFQGCLDALPGVLHSIYMTNFVPVVSGNRDFGNAKSGGVKLDYDVGVEIESVAVACVRLPTHLYRGIPPLIAPSGLIKRLPKTASDPSA
jgi:hypothetical protein